MKKLVIATFLIIAMAASLISQDGDPWYMGKPIAAVEFKGLSGVNKRDLDGLVKPWIGKPFSNEGFLELQSSIYDLDYFDSIEPSAIPGDAEGNKVIIQFKVREKPVVSKIAWEGNSDVKTTDLLEKVSVKEGDLVNKARIAADEEAIRALYREKGYSDAVVRAEERESADGTVLVFVIDEGRMIAVRKILITGNSVFSEKTLKGTITLKEAGLFQNGAFQEGLLSTSRQALQDYYLDRGYVDAKVVDVQRSYEADPKKKKDWLTITFVVTEGRQYVYQGMSFQGNAIFDTAKLESLVWQKKGQPFSKAKFTADFDRVRNLYFENGYVFNQIEPEFKKDDEVFTISVVVKIVERDRAHISNIVIKGNEKTKDAVIRRELPIEEGDIFSKRKIEEGYRNLANLQYFSSIIPEAVPVSEQLVDLVFNFTEQSTAGFNIGLSYVPTTGLAGAIPLGGFLKWNDSNFMGNGQTFATDLEFNAEKQSLTFSFTEPWLMGKRWLGGVNLSFNHQMTSIGQDIIGPIFGNNVPDPYSSYEEFEAADFVIPSEYLMDYHSLDMGLGASTGYLFKLGFADLGLRLGANTRVENIFYDAVKYRPYKQDVRNSRGVWQLQNGLTFYGYADGLDLSYNPSKGWVVTSRTALSGFLPFEVEHYIKQDFKAQFYATLFNVPVSENWRFKGVLGMNSSLSLLMAQPGRELGVKTGNWLRVDGMMTMRGWTNLSTFDATGIFYNWLEFRLPIFEQYLWLDAFLDGAVVQTPTGLVLPGTSGADIQTGGTGNDWMAMTADNWAFSTGLMLRLTIPNFPLRFGIAKKFIYRDGALRGATGDLFNDKGVEGAGFNLILSLTTAAY